MYGIAIYVHLFTVVNVVDPSNERIP